MLLRFVRGILCLLVDIPYKNNNAEFHVFIVVSSNKLFSKQLIFQKFVTL